MAGSVLRPRRLALPDDAVVEMLEVEGDWLERDEGGEEGSIGIYDSGEDSAAADGMGM